MQKNAMWKLAALAGVVAVGFFAVLQTQRGLRNDDDTGNTETASDHKSDDPKGHAHAGGALPQGEPINPGGSPFGDTGSDVPRFDLGKGTENNGSGTKPSGDGVSSPFPGSSAGTGSTPPKPEIDGFAPKNKKATTPKTNTNDKPEPLFPSTIPANLGGLKTSPGNTGSDAPKPLFGPDPKSGASTTATNPNAGQGAAPSPFGPTITPKAKADPRPLLAGPEKSGSKPDEVSGGGAASEALPLFPGPGIKLPAGKKETSSGPFDAPMPKAGTSPKTARKSGTDGPFGTGTAPAAGTNDKQPAKSLPETSPFDTKSGGARAAPDKSGAAEPPKSLFDPADKTSKSGSPGKLAPSPNAAPIGTPTAGDPNTAATQPATAQQQPHLTIEKTAPKNAVLGKPFVYDILIRNRGKSAAGKVVVTDPIPSGVRLVGTDPQALLTNNKLVWRLGQIPAGETRKISVKVTPVRGGQIGSVATVNFVAAVSAKTTITAPKLTLDIQAPTKAKVGQQVTFRFKLSNIGSGTAKDVWLRDIIPDGLKHPAGNDLEYKIGTLAPGKSENIALKMTVVKSGQITNRATVTAAGGVRVESKSVLNVPATRIVIARTGPRKRYVGRNAIYQNVLTNDSNETVNSATMTEAVPVGMEFVKASDGGKYDAARRTVSWTLGPLTPQKSHTVTLTLLPKAIGVQHSVISVVTADGTSVQTASATKVEGYAALAIDATSIDKPVTVGEEVTIRIVGRNRGSAASSNVRMKVTLPKQLRLVTVRGNGKYRQTGNTVTFEPITSLGGNERATYDLVLKAAGTGDARVKVEIQSNEMTTPLSREEAVLVLPNQ